MNVVELCGWRIGQRDLNFLFLFFFLSFAIIEIFSENINNKDDDKKLISERLIKRTFCLDANESVR
jgi:hypothetical protein